MAEKGAILKIALCIKNCQIQEIYDYKKKLSIKLIRIKKPVSNLSKSLTLIKILSPIGNKDELFKQNPFAGSSRFGMLRDYSIAFKGNLSFVDQLNVQFVI